MVLMWRLINDFFLNTSSNIKTRDWYLFKIILYVYIGIFKRMQNCTLSFLLKINLQNFLRKIERSTEFHNFKVHSISSFWVFHPKNVLWDKISVITMQSTVSYTIFVHDTLSLSNMCHSYCYYMYCIIIEYTQSRKLLHT